MHEYDGRSAIVRHAPIDAMHAIYCCRSGMCPSDTANCCLARFAEAIDDALTALVESPLRRHASTDWTSSRVRRVNLCRRNSRALFGASNLGCRLQNPFGSQMLQNRVNLIDVNIMAKLTHFPSSECRGCASLVKEVLKGFDGGAKVGVLLY